MAETIERKERELNELRARNKVAMIAGKFQPNNDNNSPVVMNVSRKSKMAEVSSMKDRRDETRVDQGYRLDKDIRDGVDDDDDDDDDVSNNVCDVSSRLDIYADPEISMTTSHDDDDDDYDDDIYEEESLKSSDYHKGPFIYTYHERDDARSASSSVSSITNGDSIIASPRQQSPRKSSPRKVTAVSNALLGVVFEGVEEEIVFESEEPKSPDHDSFSDEPLYFHTVPSQTKVHNFQEPGVFTFDIEQNIGDLSVGKISTADEIVMSSFDDATKSGAELSPSYERRFERSLSWGKITGKFLRIGRKYDNIRSPRKVSTTDLSDDLNGDTNIKVVTTSHCSTKQRLRWLFVLIFTVGMGVAGMVLLTGEKTNDETMDGSGSRFSDHWVGNNTMVTREELFREALGSLSGFEVLDDTEKPQYRALEWLANEDKAQLTITKTKFDTVRERYIAALLFFAMDGIHWKNKLFFLSDRPVCQWNNMVKGDAGQNKMLRGIICNDEGQIISIKLGRNNMSGQLPSEIAVVDSLYDLIIPRNNITGYLPSQLGLLSNLRTLDLTSNSLEGTLATELGLLGQLQDLRLKQNVIKGSIPFTFGNLMNAQYIDISDNKLTGNIPSEIGILSSLTHLDLSNNRLTGTIPSQLAAGESSFFNLTMNHFEGSLKDFCTSGSNMIWADCAGTDVEIQCDCCICCDKSTGCNL